jgi:hypothetical protein
MSGADKTKLNGIATGATANATDAALRDRATHSGTQASTTISDFAEAVDDRVAALLVAGANVTLSYNDAGNALTIAAAGGGGATNLSYDAASRTVVSDTGTDAVLPVFTSGNAGLVPASGGGTTAFLRADGTFAVPPGGGAGTDLTYVASSRTLESSTGADVVLPLVSGTSPGLAAAPEAGPGRFYAFNDCGQITSGPDFTFAQSGTGANWTLRTDLPDGGVGWANGNLGTGAINGVALTTGVAALRLGLGHAKSVARIRQLLLSDAVTTFSQQVGFIDITTAAGEPVDGVFFRYSDTLNGGRWAAVSRSNNVETAVDTGVTVAINTTYKLEVEVNAAGTSALFVLNGTSVATITSNIPTAVGRETGAGLQCRRTVGTGAATPFAVDYVLVEQTLTAPR